MNAFLATSNNKNVVDLSKFDESSNDHTKWQVFKPNMAKKFHWAWKYFGQYAQRHHCMQFHVCCNICYEVEMNKQVGEIKCENWEVGYTKDRSTSKLENHMSSYHEAIYKEEIDKIALKTINDKSDEGKTVYPPNSVGNHFSTSKSLNFYETQLKWMLMTYQPLSTVEDPHYRDMLASLNHKEVTTSDQIKKQMCLKESEMREICMRALRTEHFALTTDNWTSAANENYISLTAHFIDENWEYRSLVIACSPYSDNHEAISIVSEVKDILKNNGLDLSRVSAIVTDTAPNINATAPLWLDFPWHGCVAHVLQITANYAFKGNGVERNMAALRHSVGYFKGSTQTAKALTNAQLIADQHATTLSVCQDVVTRWWSTHDMLERHLKLRNKIDAVMTMTDTAAAKRAMLTPEDWKVAETVRRLLAPFKEFQVYMEGSKYVTLSFVPFAIAQIRESMLSLAANETTEPLAQDTIKSLYFSFCAEWGSGEEGSVFGEREVRGARNRVKGLPYKTMLASVVDPRTKNLDIGLSPADKEKVWAALQYEVEQLYLEDHRQHAAARLASDQQVAKDAADAMDNASNKQNSVFAALTRAAKSTAAVEEENYADVLEEAHLVALREIKFYKRAAGLPPISTQNVGDPLAWWKEHQLEFAHIARLARRLLCIPATSAPSERLFSTAGLTVSDKRTNLKAGTVSELVFLHEAYPFYDYLESRRADESLRSVKQRVK